MPRLGINKMKKYNYLLVFLYLFLQSTFTQAQDTLRLTLQQAEDQFIKSNLQLMAQKMGITESKAYELQASLRPNPSIYVEHMPYNFARNEVGGFTNNINAQQSVQFQQLIEMAGKRGKRIELARLGTEQAENQFLILVQCIVCFIRY